MARNAPQTTARTKGNPAHKRMSNANLKARRAGSWAAGQLKRELNREAQDKRKRQNIVNGFKPWDVAQEIRRQRRLADPDIQRRRILHERGEL